MTDFSKLSYESHEKHFLDYASGGDKEKHAKTWFKEDTIDAWRHLRMYKLINPLLELYPDANWLTVGDGRYGKDAHYIEEKGVNVLASDISDVLLKEAKASGYIENYKKENAESLSFSDNEFDFTFCKEAYHHFPRPMIALYEMLRVSRQGVVLIEPNDRYIVSSHKMLIGRNIENFIRMLIGKKAPRHHFEESGNYGYSISMREIEKAALGINLPAVAFKGISDYYERGVEYVQADDKNWLFKKVKWIIKVRDVLCKINLLQYGGLVAIIFKHDISHALKIKLESFGYRITSLPKKKRESMNNNLNRSLPRFLSSCF